MKTLTHTVWTSCFVVANMCASPQAGELSAGMAIFSTKPPFIGEDVITLPIPVIKYETENFHYFLDTAAYTFVKHQSDTLSWSAAGIAKLRFLDRDTDGDLAGMEDRDPSLDLGFKFNTKAFWGGVSLMFIADATSTHGGNEASLSYSYDHMATNELIFIPAIEFDNYSKKLSDFIYGVRASEAIPVTRPEYHPDNATIAKLSLTIVYLLSNNWTCMQYTGVTRLHNTLTDSPIVAEDKEVQLFFGALYKFN